MGTVILISGPQGSGKTTLQNALSSAIYSRLKKRVQKVNFADVLYEIHNYALNRLAFYGYKRDIVKDGPLLQLLGTEWARKHLGENVWVDIAKNKINNVQDDAVTIIGDCRFPNEFDGFPSALRIRLHCDESVRK